ncbi:hypothetical protein B488_04810 [Liberibacter crescens BT-1]|uniref:Uncharacterized protein n=2 Tax=Liberibacter crescens TaxID=1273132 RepID=L0EUY7_LIBCB|nr:hypothetical protein B488_04810 [Liberibacter crescens BT-1]AMC12640.1 hypothetical protein RL73_02510 [Liberibacter crescens]
MSNAAEKRESYDRTNDHEVRITLLERGLENIDKRFDKLEAKIDASISTLGAKIEAQGKEIAEVKGKISQMPTTFQLIGIIITVVLAVMTASFTLLKFGAPFLEH